MESFHKSPQDQGSASTKHKESNHLLIRQGNKFSYVLVPSQFSSNSENELELCFTNHNNTKWDPTLEKCCLREVDHVHAHVHNGDSVEDILLEECMDGSGCTLPFPFDFSSSFSKVLSDDIDKHHEHSDIGHHEHQEECDHEQILHRDHLDCLMPTSDGSFVLTHGHVGNGKAHEHGRLIKVGESQGRSGNNSKRFFDLFQYQCPHNSSSNVNKDGLIHRTSAAAFAKCLHCSGAPEILELSEIAKPLLVEEQVIIPIDNCGIESIKWEKTVIDVLGICCPAEAPLVKKLLEPIPGVQEVSVNVATKTVTVHHDPIAVPPLRLVKVLNSAQLDASIHVSGEWKAGHRWPSPYTIASGVLLTIAFFSYIYHPLKWVALGAVAVGIPPILMKSFISLRRCMLDINILMIIAVGGAIALGDYLEGGAIVFLFTVAEWLESRSSDKARVAISSVAKLAPQDAVLANNGLRIPVAEIKVGTRIVVKAGESIPIDGIVASGRSTVDESSLTGESSPIEKEVGAQVWAGTINVTGYVCVETSALAEDSAVARMIRLVEDSQTQRSHMEQLVEKCAKVYTPAVVIVAVAVAIVPLIAHAHGIKHWLYLALVLLVIACPCALVISTPIATTCAIAQAARTGLIIKGGKHLEALGKIKVLAMDKTGTLTEGFFQVIEMQPLNDRVDTQKLLHWISSIESKSSHPMASAIVEYARRHGAEPNGEVVDFTILVGEGVSGKVDGYEICIGNERMADRLQWTEAEIGYSTLLDSWRIQGLTISWVSVDGIPQLIFSAGDQIREETVEAAKSIRNLGVRLVMLTGDSTAAATVVQEKLGEIDVHAQCLPEHKVEVIQQLKALGRIGMVGDGINDAPALAAADVGIAMGVAGTAIAMETADIALMTNDLRQLSTAIKLARKARNKIQQNIVLSITTKIAVFVLSLVGYAYLWVAVLADVGTCLAVIFNSILLLEMKRGRSDIGHKHGHKHEHKHAHKKCQSHSSCCSKNSDSLCCTEEGMGDHCVGKSCCESTHSSMRRRLLCDKNRPGVAEGHPAGYNSCVMTGEPGNCSKTQAKCCQREVSQKHCNSKQQQSMTKSHVHQDQNLDKTCLHLKENANTNIDDDGECCGTTSHKLFQDQTCFKDADCHVDDSSELASQCHGYGSIANWKELSQGSVAPCEHKENLNLPVRHHDCNSLNISRVRNAMLPGNEAACGSMNLQGSRLDGRSLIQAAAENGCESRVIEDEEARTVEDCCQIHRSPVGISTQHTKGCNGCCDH